MYVNMDLSWTLLVSSIVCCWERACSIFGVSVFNVSEVGFDSPTKLVSGGLWFMVDPALRHCTFSHGLD